MDDKSIMHYRSSHKILLVGEGNFSFSLCLARAFGTGVNMVATSLESKASLRAMYGGALRNLTELKILGCTIVHKVDVHTMTQHPRLKDNKFDRIIFNFPHAGFHGDEREDHQIEFHKKLVSGFLKNAKDMLAFGGEIHITHKTTYPFTEWNIEKLANQEGLILVGELQFLKCFYPGYLNKRGSGVKCDRRFPINKSSTFKFAMKQ